jgi:hypothetical protein
MFVAFIALMGFKRQERHEHHERQERDLSISIAKRPGKRISENKAVGA